MFVRKYTSDTTWEPLETYMANGVECRADAHTVCLSSGWRVRVEVGGAGDFVFESHTQRACLPYEVSVSAHKNDDLPFGWEVEMTGRVSIEAPRIEPQGVRDLFYDLADAVLEYTTLHREHLFHWYGEFKDLDWNDPVDPQYPQEHALRLAQSAAELARNAYFRCNKQLHEPDLEAVF